MLSVRIIPNPAKDEAEARVTVVGAGTVILRVYDALGKAVMPEQRIDIAGGGTYAVPVNTSGLRPGIYTVVIEQNHGRTTSRFSIAR